MMKIVVFLFATAGLFAASTAQAADGSGDRSGPVIGHDGQHLAGAFTTTDMNGVVQFWRILPDESMVWTDNFGHTGTGHHYKGPDGRNCIQPGPGEGPAYCFSESKPSAAGRWVAIRDDTREGVVVQRLAVAPASKGN